jgi:hypothetical protein
VNDDPDIRKRFAALRDEDRSRAPAFEEVLRRGPRQPHISPALAAAACLVVGAAIVAVLHTAHEPTASTPGGAVATLALWRAPTDFLLDTPGRELLYAVPRIGETDALNPFPTPHGSPRRPTGQEPPS